MDKKLPNLTVTHRRIENPESPTWDLTSLSFKGGISIYKSKSYLIKVYKLPFVEHRIKWLNELKAHLEGVLDSGGSPLSVINFIYSFNPFIAFCDEKGLSVETRSEIQTVFYKYAEYQFAREQHNIIQLGSGYRTCSLLSTCLSAIIESNQIDIKSTRLKKKKNSRRAISREADKTNLVDAAKFAKFAYDICKNFDPKTLDSAKLPILVKVRKELSSVEINLTLAIKSETVVNGGFKKTDARHAFNRRVAFECLIFLAMTMQNAAPTFKLRRVNFIYKPMGEQYEVREYKNRRGGEVLFKIPKPYRETFEAYLSFMSDYGEDTEYLFPIITNEGAYRKRTDTNWTETRTLTQAYKIPYIAPRSFRKIGLNILLRLSADEETAADYGNHTVATFRESYEFPSQQRAMVEIARFWQANDPLEHGEPKLSLFNTPCNGIPEPFDDATDKLAKPDCLTPSGCMGCKHYRDEDSLDYVWNLYSFRYLKIIESSSYLDVGEKPSNIAIDWVNLKINWFNNSKAPAHQKWIEEGKIRLEEGEYHPNWDRKIQKYEK